MAIASVLQSAWSFLTIAVYAGAYSVTKDTIAGITAPHKTELEPLTTPIMAAGLLGTLVVGIVADKVSARAAVNLTSLFSALIYAAAYLALDGKLVSAEQQVYLAMALKGFTVLQHTMLAMTTYACIRGVAASSTAALGAVVQIGAGYTIGAIAAARLVKRFALTDLDVLGFSGVATLLTIVISWIALAEVQALVLGRRADGSHVTFLAPGTRKSFLRVAVVALPTLVFVGLLRIARLYAQSSRELLPTLPWVDSLPVPIDQAAGLAMNVFVFPSLMVYCRGPGTIMAVVLAVLVAARTVMVFDRTSLADRVVSQELYVVLTLCAQALYTLPTALVGITAEVGTKGRVLALQAVVSSVIMQYGTTIRATLLQQAEALAPAITAATVSKNDLEFFIVAIAAGSAFIMLPAAAMQHPSTSVVQVPNKPATAAMAAAGGPSTIGAASAGSSKPAAKPSAAAPQLRKK